MDLTQKLDLAAELSTYPLDIYVGKGETVLSGIRESDSEVSYGSGDTLEEALDQLLEQWGYSKAMLKRKWVVRVINPSGIFAPELPSLDQDWMEIFHHAGVVQTHVENEHCWDLLPPADVKDSKAWAEQMLIKMETFGINAAIAPKWQ